MKTAVVELFSEPTNNAIVRIPGRKFPGVLIQGDTLHTLYADASAVWTMASKHGDAEMSDEAFGLKENLADLLRCYEKALAEHGLSLPYPEKVSDG